MIKLKLTCSECGEPLTVSSRKGHVNNMLELDHVELFVEPCAKCIKDIELIKRKNMHGCTDAYCAICDEA
jgi:hypothetical protein